MYEKIESSKVAKAAKKRETDLYPGCNIQYISESQKSKVWCTTLRWATLGDCWLVLIFNIYFLVYNFHSGGVKRNWTGVPRKLQMLDENGKLSVRCACVQPDKLSKAELAHIIEYDGCDANSITCQVVIS